MAVELAAAGAMAKAFSPVLTEIYKSSKSALQKNLAAWKAGSDTEKLEQYISRLSNIKTIWSRDEAKQIDSFYYPSRVGRSQHTIESIDDLGEKSCVIQGIVGQGKSVFMRHLAISTFKRPANKTIPLFAELRYISEKVNLTQLLCTNLSLLGASDDPAVLLHLFEQNKVILLLDGFDEIEPKFVKETTSTIINIQSTFPNLKIVVSSRPYNDIQNVASFNVQQLDELRPKDHEPFLKRLGVETTRIVEIVDAIRNSPQEIQEAISTPLMMSLVVLVYKSENQIPPYLAKFFNVLFHVVFTKHDTIKDSFRRTHNTGLSEAEIQELFEAFCFSVTQREYGRTLSREKFNECYRHAQQLAPLCQTNSSDFKSDIVDVACLMLEEGVGELTFLHKGILDFFSAAFASKRKASSAEKFYEKAAANHNNWKGALQFLSKIDQYHFNKFYLLKSVHSDWMTLNEILESDDPLKLLEYCENLFSEAETIKTEDNGGMARFVMATQTQFTEAAAHQVTKNWPHAEFALITLESTKEIISVTKGAQFEVLNENGIKFGLRSTLLAFGSDKIRLGLRKLYESHVSVFRDATLHVAQEETRQKLIDMSLD